ncbi:hypothetical protein FQN54_006773 [Arachnomyces sp. PD_36]|nr:hypothetical protein FQN54_006773 [Arachnomyces sp. PD_36]
MSPVTNPFTAPRQAGQQMAEKAKQGKTKVAEQTGMEPPDSSKDKMPSQRPRTLSNEDVDKMAPEQLFRTTLDEHGDMVQDESIAKQPGKAGAKDEDDDLDLYDAMTAE